MEKYENNGSENIEPTALPEGISLRMCPNCKNIAKEEDLFCSKCGEQIDFKPSVIYRDYSRDRYKTEEKRRICEFVSSSSDYYIRKFETQDITEKNATWNWPAFLVSPMWCFYRKQYILGASIMASSFILNYLGGIGDLIQFGIAIYIGFMGNYFYRGYIEKHLEVSSEMPYDARIKYYEKKGGTSYLAVLIGFCAVFLLTYLILR